ALGKRLVAPAPQALLHPLDFIVEGGGRVLRYVQELEAGNVRTRNVGVGLVLQDVVLVKRALGDSKEAGAKDAGAALRAVLLRLDDGVVEQIDAGDAKHVPSSDQPHTNAATVGRWASRTRLSYGRSP